MGNDWNLLVSDTELLMRVEWTAFLHCTVSIGKSYFLPYICFIFGFETLVGFFFRVLVELGVTIGLFSKTFVGDVHMTLFLHVTNF